MKTKTVLLTTVFLSLAIWVNAQSKSDFCKKWHLSGYIYKGTTYSPEKDEKNDYILFNSDGTFTSEEKGEIEKGTWEWKSKDNCLYFYDKSSDEGLPFQVVKISKNELIILFKDENGEIKIRYTTKK